jgi:O-antigen/teichoic acid export membrane protein
LYDGINSINIHHRYSVSFAQIHMTQTSLAQTQETTNLGSLAQNTIIVLIIQVAGVILTYCMTVALVRWMGKDEYGLYEYAMTWALFLAIPASLGLPRAVIRFMSEYRVQQEWGKLRGLFFRSWQITIGIGLLFSLGELGIVSFLNHSHSFVYAGVLSIGVFLIPLQALLQLQEDMARGSDLILLGSIPSKVLWPIILLGGGFLLFHQHNFLVGEEMVRVAIVTLIGITLFQFGFLWYKIHQEIESESPIYQVKEWLTVALPLLLHRAFVKLVIRIDIIMVGAFLSAGAVGLYSAASKTCTWISFVSEAVNFVGAPALAILYVKGDFKALQNLVSKLTAWIFIPSFLIAFGLIIFSRPALGIFGAEFSDAEWVLRILALGQIISAWCGSVGNFMSMTGHQNQALKVSAWTAIVNVVLNAIAIPLWGGVGAAMATTLSLAFRNLWLRNVVIQEVGIRPSFFYVIQSQFSRRQVANIEEEILKH